LEIFMQRFSLIAATIALVSSPAGIVLAQGTPGTVAGAATTPPASSATTAAEPAKKKSAKKMTRQQEIDKSIDSGTVPARYRSSVPKQYQQYIPFDKR
jgi:hypothetical protein